MSADNDTFEIDIYGDDQPEQEPVKSQPQQENGHGYDGTNDRVKPEPKAETSGDSTQQDGKQQPAASATPTQQGVKRKASDDGDNYKEEYDAEDGYGQYVDNRPVDQGAMPSLKLADLHWWTTEEDVRGFCARAGAEEELHEISFGEHKINGKSKGEVYLEFASPQAATAVKREIEAASQIKGESGVRKTPLTAYFTPVGNPFKTTAGGGGKKDFSQNSSRGGAYNSFNNRGGGGGGGFAGRGNYNNNNRGGAGFNNNNNMMQNRPQQQAGWGMNAGMGANGGMGGNGAMGGYGGFTNPMMAGAGFGAMNMGYGNMGRGGMMNNMGMMGRGGFGGMGMGNMNMGGMMGAGRGGNAMMGGGGRGGWGGGAAGGAGFQQGGYGGGGGGGGYAAGSMSPQGQGGNKRAKME
ncbi:hypothetical protein LTR85_008839 [Meristemomyces frigidus]|nr:hypothetical protein LTR85_008839 [Meristemomyces frigidus]